MRVTGDVFEGRGWKGKRLEDAVLSSSSSSSSSSSVSQPLSPLQPAPSSAGRSRSSKRSQEYSLLSKYTATFMSSLEEEYRIEESEVISRISRASKSANPIDLEGECEARRATTLTFCSLLPLLSTELSSSHSCPL